MTHSHSFNGESVLASSSPCSQCRSPTCPDCGDFKAGVWTCWDCSTGRTKAMEDQDDKDEAEIAAYKRSQFTEAEYAADTRRVIEYAVKYGHAVVVRADGSVRVVISIPPAELPAPPTAT